MGNFNFDFSFKLGTGNYFWIIAGIIVLVIFYYAGGDYSGQAPNSKPKEPVHSPPPVAPEVNEEPKQEEAPGIVEEPPKVEEAQDNNDSNNA